MKALTIILLLAATGCENYQFGDVTKTALKARSIYCSATTDSQREAAKAKLEGMGIDTGRESICTLTIEVLLED